MVRHVIDRGKEIVWNHLVRAVQDDGDKGLKLIIKLNAEQIRLNPYSKMNVRLAIQVLSESVGKHLYTYHGPECHGTADLCMMMDTFFDLLNIKNDIATVIATLFLIPASWSSRRDNVTVTLYFLYQLHGPLEEIMQQLYLVFPLKCQYLLSDK